MIKKVKSRFQVLKLCWMRKTYSVFKIIMCYQYFSNIAMRIRQSDIFKSCSYPSFWEKLTRIPLKSHHWWACHNHSLICKNRKLNFCIWITYLASLARGDPDPEQINNGVSDSFSYWNDLMMFFEKIGFIWYSSYQHVTIKLN